MNKIDIINTLSILGLGWLIILLSTILPFIIVNGIEYSLGTITLTIWNALLLVICGVNNFTCQVFYGNYSEGPKVVLFSFNPIIITLIGIPVVNVLRLLKKSSFMFGQYGLRKLAFTLPSSFIGGVIFIVFFFISTFSFSPNDIVAVGTGFWLYVLGVIILYLATVYGKKRSSLTRDSNYQ